PPDRPLPSDPKLTVHGTTEGRITLTRALTSLRPGVYGLRGPGVRAVVGPVVDDADRPADTVVRRLERGERESLPPGTRVWLTPQVYAGAPSSALGLPHREVAVPGELGEAPAWFVPGSRTTWVITAHGLGATREHCMNVMRFLAARQFPVLDISYRG